MADRRFHALEKLINLREGYCAQFRIDQLHLLLFHRDGETHLVEAACPHRGQLLDSASVVDGSIECSAHHYRFSLRSGCLLNEPGEPCRKLKVYPLVYEGADVGLMVEDAR